MFLKKPAGKQHRTHLKRHINKKIIPAFCGLTAVVLITAFSAVAPKKGYSKAENQALATLPKLTAATWKDGSFNTSIEKYLRDHVLFRSGCIRVTNNIQVKLGSKEINGVYILPDRLIAKANTASPSISRKNIDAIRQFMNLYNNKTPCYFGLIPTAAEIYKEDLPAPKSFNQQGFITEMYGVLTQTDTIDLYTSLNALKSDKLYYNSDERWTSAGAHAGYSAIVKAMGETPYAENLFNIEHASYDFYGNLYQKTYIKTQPADIVDLYHFSKGSPVAEVEKISNDKAEIFPSIYFRELLDSPAKQSVFLGASFAVTNIRSSLENGKKLLIFKDSFTNPLMQFLPLHYQNITLVDLSLISEKELKGIDPESYTSVLFLYNINTFSTDSSIAAKLNMYQSKD